MRAQGNPEAAKVKNPTPSSAESIESGRVAFQRYCAPCHGKTAEGGPGNDLIPAAPNLTDAKWEHGSTDGEIFDNIKNGVQPDLNMVPFGSMIKDPDIWNLVNYIRSLAKEKPAN